MVRGEKLGTLVVAFAVLAASQTKVNLRHQGRDVDFSSMSSVRPFPTGPTLPATCVTGETFFKTDELGGGNLYMCLSGNWVRQGGDLPGSGLSVARVSSTRLVIGQECSLNKPCNVRIGSAVFTYTVPASVDLAGGSGAVRIFVDRTGQLAAGASSPGAPDLRCTGCVIYESVADFPSGAIPVAIWNASAGSWEPSGTDLRAALGGERSLVPGQGTILAETSTQVVVSNLLATGSQGCIQSPGMGYWFPFGVPQGELAEWIHPLLGEREAQYVQVVTPPCPQTISKVVFRVTSPCSTACGLIFAIYDGKGDLVAQTLPVEGLTVAGYYAGQFGTPVALSGSTVYYLMAAADSTELRLAGAWTGWQAHSFMNTHAVRIGRGAPAIGTGSSLTAPSQMGNLVPWFDGYGVPPIVMFER